MVHEQKQRESIISAATKLFSRYGLEKTTMEDIARAARKGKSSLYYYFPSKEMVFAEVIRREISGLEAAITLDMKSEIHPDAKLKAFVQTRLRYLVQTADQFTSIKAEHIQNYEFIQSLSEDHLTWQIETLEEILELGRTNGYYGLSSTTAVARAFLYALKGFEYPWMADLATVEMEESANVLLDILLEGIRKR
jgi:AcrR family transcriptional regulator